MTIKELKPVFLPAFLLSVLLSGSSALLYLAGRSLISSQPNLFPVVPYLQMLSIPLQIILVLVLFLVSKRKSFEKVFKVSFIVFIGIISTLTALVFFQEHIHLQGALTILEGLLPKSLAQTCHPLFSNWATSLFYTITGLFNFSFFALFVWGFLNRCSTKEAGLKYYLPLSLIFGLAGGVISNLALSLLSQQNNLSFMAIPAIFLMICALAIFSWTWKKLPPELVSPKEEPPEGQIRFPFISGAYLIAGCLISVTLLNVLLKYQTNLKLASPNAYAEFMGRYAMAAGGGMIIFSIIWVILGLVILRKKGWRAAAISGCWSIFLGGLLFLGLNSFSDALPWLQAGLYTSLIISTSSALFFPLVQLLYLCLPYQIRFRTKIVTEMIALPIMQSLPSFLVQGIIMALGSLAAAIFYLKILVPVFLLLLLVASRRAGAKFADKSLSNI